MLKFLLGLETVRNSSAVHYFGISTTQPTAFSLLNLTLQFNYSFSGRSYRCESAKNHGKSYDQMSVHSISVDLQAILELPDYQVKSILTTALD